MKSVCIFVDSLQRSVKNILPANCIEFLYFEHLILALSNSLVQCSDTIHDTPFCSLLYLNLAHCCCCFFSFSLPLCFSRVFTPYSNIHLKAENAVCFLVVGIFNALFAEQNASTHRLCYITLLLMFICLWLIGYATLHCDLLCTGALGKRVYVCLFAFNDLFNLISMSQNSLILIILLALFEYSRSFTLMFSVRQAFDSIFLFLRFLGAHKHQHTLCASAIIQLQL